MRLGLLFPLTLAPALFAQGQHAYVPGAGLNFYKLDREIALGAQLAADVRRESRVLDNVLVQDYVARIGRQLTPQAHGPAFPYAFTVVADLPASPNTNSTHEPLALPGGPIFVPAALLLEAQSTAEFAGMLAHAIAHVADRDCTRMATRAELMQIGTSPSLGCWPAPGIDRAIPLGYLQFERTFERQADYLAVQIMAQAGYDPAALAAYIRRVQQAPVPRFSAWPSAADRVKQIGNQIAKLPPGRPYSAGDYIQPIQLAVRSQSPK